MRKAILLSFLLIGLFSNYLLAQCTGSSSPSLSFINPSFEGPSCAGCQPGPWVDCGGTPDTQPGQWGFTQAPSNGTSYVSFLLAGSSAGGYYEGSSQALSACMTAGQVYTFSIDLAHSNVYNTAEPGDCYSSLEILGTNGLCGEDEVLWQSGLIANTNWQTYTVTLTPTSNWCYVTFRPYWISACSGYANIMMDNLGAFQTNAPSISSTVTSSISCSQNITGTTSCPADSIVLTGLFTGSPIHAVMPTDTTWNANVTYPLGAATTQKITVHAFLQTGVSLYDTITFNLVAVTPDFSAPGVCIGNATSFTDNSTVSSGSITGWNWNFGDGSPANTTQNPTHTYANPGIYTVSLLVNTSNGCTDTVSKLVKVYFKPTADFTHTDICVGSAMNFTSTSFVDPSTSMASYSWTFGDGGNSTLQSPSHLYSATGTYTVTLVATTIDGCSNTVSNPITISNASISSFTLSNTCLFDSASFTNTSVFGTISNWSWDFGDGSALNTTVWSPHHLYSAPGTFQVSLITHASTLGCPDTMKLPITVFPMPVANFSFTDVCLIQAMNFVDMSTIVGGSITGWQWDFGDNSPINTTQSPSHTYTTAGTYSVILITTPNSGCKDTIAKSVIVHPVPFPQFSFSNVCDGNPVQFANSSTIAPPETVQSYSWNFGDGSAFNTNQNTSHIYAGEGTYSVHLITVSNFGCKDSIIHTVIVNPNPVALFGNTSVCEGNATVFTDQSTTTGGNISGWSWDFGDASIFNTTQNPSYTYSGGGGYNATLIVTNNFGCADTITKPVQVYYNPTADFTHIDVCFGDSMHFTNGSSVNQSTSITSYLWVFGDGSSSGNLQNATHEYNGAGTYNATLVINTANGCSDAVSYAVNVYDAPVTGFTLANTCLFDSVVFTNTSLNPTTGTISGLSWNFGDGSPINTSAWSPHHLYPSDGNYIVTLITQSSTLGCKDTLKLPLIVFPMPISDFGSTDVCLNQVMNFNDLSTVTSGTIANWSWSFGDGSPLNTTQNTSHTYANSGTYPVFLTVASNNGCEDTLTKNVKVHPLPDAQFSAANVCDGNAVQFNNLTTIPTTDIIQSYSWNLGDGSPLSTTQAPSHLYSNAGTFTVHLTAVSNFGCIDSISKTITVNPNPVVHFTADDTVGCEPLCVTFQNTSVIATGNNNQWLWDFGDGSAGATTSSAFHCYTNNLVFSPILYSASLTVTSDSGCVKTLIKNNSITVYPMPVASFTVKPESAPLIDPVISITNQSTGSNFWNWNFGDTTTFYLPNPLPHTYPDTGTYVITLITSTIYNCRDTAYQTITIDPDFLFYIPNAFSPNGDGKNETFQGYGVGISEYQMSIFDRWGNQIFKTKDYHYPWDGKANDGNEIAQQDVYIYVISITGKKTKTRTYRGTVTLVR